MTEPVAPKKRAPMRRGISAEVLNHFLENADRSIGFSEFEKEFNLTAKQVIDAVRYNVEDKKINIVTEVRGRRWRYDSTRKSATGKRLYEELAVTKKGDILVECEDGSIYKLVEI